MPTFYYSEDAKCTDINSCDEISISQISPNVLIQSIPDSMGADNIEDENYMCIPNILQELSDLNNNAIIPPNKKYRECEHDPSIFEPNLEILNSMVCELTEKYSTAPMTNDIPDVAHVFNNIKLENTNRLVIGHLNINSLRNKFEALKCIIKDNLDILVISETKLDDTFPKNQFTLDGYNHYRIDKNSNSGGIIIFIREDIPCKTLPNTEWPIELEGIFIELNLRKSKWLFFAGYNPHKQLISQFLHCLGICLDTVINKFDNILLVGDFNSETVESDMHEFCYVYGFKNLIKEPTCYKNALNPTCIDLIILTNKYNKFQNSKTIETGISDFHKMTVTVLKTLFQKKSTYAY